MAVKGTHRWCTVCSNFFLMDSKKEHICYFNDTYFCEYNLYNISERSVAVYYCSYCTKITRWNQEVKCSAKEFSIICQFQIPRPYYCSRIDCSLHPGYRTIFCTKQRNFKNALITEYKHHVYNDKTPNKCLYCGDTKEQSAAYCHEHSKVEKLQEYLNKFPLLSKTRVNITPNIIWELGTLDKNVSCFNCFFENYLHNF